MKTPYLCNRKKEHTTLFILRNHTDMNIKHSLIPLCLACLSAESGATISSNTPRFSPEGAVENTPVAIPDSARTVGLDNLVVVATPKEHALLEQLPLSSTSISPQTMERQHVNSIKDLTALAPSLFIPDYGARSTSAIYMRGIGSRINTPSVGLYVDNIPFLEKSAYDLSYYDIDRIDILRGPQATLYGRNAMGGLIKIHTKSPMDYQGTDLRIRNGMFSAHSASLTHYHRISPQFAFSAGGFYEYNDGYLKNSYLKKRADDGQQAGGRLHAIWRPRKRWELDFNADYQYSDQAGYAYGAYDKETRQVADVDYNDDGSYYRNLLNASLNIKYQGQQFLLSSATGYQYLRDRMYMDQDFTSASIYTLEQKQRLHSLFQEVTLRSRGKRRWDWLQGISAFYQSLHTSSPVIFRQQGVANLLENNINSYLPDMLDGQFDVTSSELPVFSDFDTPLYGLAAYHQSTLNDLFLPNLSLTLGLRLDYEHMKLGYRSSAQMPYAFPITAMGQHFNLGNTVAPTLAGDLSDDYLQLLPKLSLAYHFSPSRQIYFSLAKGYRSGGYNIQMFSDIMSQELQAALTGQLRTDLGNTMTQAMTQAGMPQAAIDRIVGQVTGMIPAFDRQEVAEAVPYKPEYCWSYEAGIHWDACEGKVKIDAALFYTDIYDQQIARFTSSNLGRIMVNAGRSRSYGAEAALQAAITQNWTVAANYGYTNATFIDYKSGTGDNGQDYSGNYVPFIPRHTLCLTTTYNIPCAEGNFIDHAYLSASYRGVGSIYWTEQNDVSQPFYSLLSYNIGVTIGKAEIIYWMQNLTDTDYVTFCFNNSTRSDAYFAQRGAPFRMGVDLRLRF